MSKIICDVCGTSFPETASQCPICGCVRSGDAKVIASDANEPEANGNGSYTYVKGGRFSKSNVKKRNKSAHINVEGDLTTQGGTGGEGAPNNVGLVVVVIALLLAIVAVVIYIVTRFFAPVGDQKVPTPSTEVNSTTTQATEESTVDTTTFEILCTDIVASKTVMEFDSAEATGVLDVTVEPVDTTDEIVFTSADETIATVSADGTVTAVGPGETVITVQCGEVTAECRVVCTFEAVTPDAPIETPEYSTENFKLRKTDISMGQKGQTYVLYKGEIPVELITWTSGNEKVATVENGTVKAVGKGTTKIYAEYGGVKLECVVRCKDTVGAYTDTNTNTNTNTNTSTDNNENSGNSTTTTGIHLNKTDVTLRLSGTKTFILKLLDENGNTIDTEWVVANAEMCSITNDGVVEALAVGTKTTISTTYEGVTYSCIVRVKE